MKDRPILHLAAGRDKSVLRRHPWIFSGAVKRVDGSPHEGDVVDVYNADGNWVAVGHYQNETIMCKVLSFEHRNIDKAFWRARLCSAIAYRKRLGLFNASSNNVFRLIHAEGDNMPGLVADYYNGVVVCQAHSMGMYLILDELSQLLADLFAADSDLPPLKAIFDKSSATLPSGGVEDHFIIGDAIDKWEILENGNRIMIDFYEGQKTGFFLDQRENCLLLQQMARGCRVLNCFGYTGGFSLAALRGGASYVETVDISKKAIALCEENVLNNFGASAPHKGVVADVLQYLDSIGNDLDIIILDPPAFAKRHSNLQQGLKGYRNINRKAMAHIKNGGLLFTFSCSQAVSRNDFQTLCFTAAAEAHKQVRIVRMLPHAPDHPVSIYHPEGEYLKGLVLQVEDL